MKASAIIEDVTIRARSEGVEATAAAAERLATAGDAVVASSERQTRSTLSVERAYERLQRQIDASYRQSQLFEQGQRTLDRALQQNVISTDAHQRSLGLLQARYASAGAAVNDNTATMSRFERQTGLASHQVTNLGYQLNDVAVSLAGGQSPFTVLVQQGSQILPILSAAPGGVGGALLGIGSYLVGLVNPATVAAAALLAVGTTAVAGLSRYGAETEALRKSLTGVGASTATTVDGLSRIAAGAAATGKVTESMARDVAAALAATGKIGVENFEGIIARTKDFASVMGLDAKEAAEKLATAFSDPVKGADDLNQQLGFLSDKTRQYIVDLANQNDRTGAQKALLEALGPSLDDAANRTTALGKAWNFVANAASAAATAMAKAINGPSDVELLNAARSTLETAKQNRGKLGPFGFLAATESDIKGYEESVASLQEKIRQDGARSASIAREAAARTLSIAGGEIARSLDPVNAKFDELKSKRDKLGAALTRPEDLANVEQVRTAYNAYDRAVSSLTDSQGKLISSSELLSQKDELAIAAKKATTDADKAAIAEKQKALDLVGEVITKEDAARRVAHAGALERIKDAKDSGAADKDAADAFDNALQRSKDQIEELRQQQEQASKTTAEVYKLTEANKLRRAAASAGRSDEEGMAKLIDQTAEAYARQRVATEQAIEAQKRFQDSQRELAESISSFVKDLVGGKGLEAALKSLGQTYLTNSLDALLTGKGPLAGALGLAPTEKGGVGGIFNFDYAKLTKAVTEGTTQGTFSGFTSLFGSPQQGPTQNGKTLDTVNGGGLSGLAGLGGAALGAYGAGASGGALAGGLTGALAGAAAGAAFGPAGIAIGAIIGAGAGILGANSAAKKAKEAREAEAQANYKQAQPDIVKLGSQLRGDPQNTLAQQIAEAEAAARKLGDVAFFAGKTAEQDKLFADFVTYRNRTLDEFRNTFGGLVQALGDGTGPDSPFARSRDAVKSLGDQLKVFVDNAKTAFGEGSAQVDQARQASAAYALTVLSGSNAMSVVATRFEEIRGASAALQQVLQDLGMSEEEAAKAAADRAAKAREEVKQNFEKDLGSKTIDAQGYGYLNDFRNLREEYQQLVKDAQETGTSGTQVNNYFAVRAQELVNSANLTGKAFEDLIARFPELSGVVHEAGITMNAFFREMEADVRRLGYSDRVFAATNDNTTLQGQLAAFERDAEKQRKEEIRVGGDAINELEAALGAERLKIISDFAKAALEEQKRAQLEAQNFFDAFSKNLRQFVDGLRTGSDSPLSPQARRDEAAAQFEAQLALAQTGNRDAINSLTTYSSAFLTTSKAFFASSAGYQADFARVTAALLALPTQVSAEQFIVDAIKETTAAVDANGDGFISRQEATIAGLGSIFNELDTNGDGMLSATEIIKAASQKTATETTTQTAKATETNDLLNATYQVQNAIYGVQSLINSLTQSQNYLLNQLVSLNATSSQTLAALQNQFGTNNTVTFQGVSLTNNMVEALNKIVFNTASTVIGGKSGAPYTYAEGGWVRGPGTGTSDSISAMLSNGEFVVTAEAAARNRALLESINGGAGTLSTVALPAVAPFAVPVAANANGGGSDEIVAELRRLHDRIAQLEARLVEAEYGAAGVVAGKVDDVARETRGARSDARQARNDPRNRAA